LLFTLSLLISSAYADAISKWAKGEFSLSTLSEKQRIKELQWFQKAAKPFKGMEINVLSETIPTHTYESKLLPKHLRKLLE
jgi:glycerol transport system substrate-binding protein